MGRTIASFHSFVTVRVVSERFIMLAMMGNCLRRQVGIGSCAHILYGANATRLETVSTDTLLN